MADSLEIALDMIILTKSDVEIPASDWAQFDSWLHEEPKVIPQIEELMTQKLVWD